MNPRQILTMPARLDMEPVGFIPEPIEAWTLADFAGIELGARDDDESNNLLALR